MKVFIDLLAGIVRRITGNAFLMRIIEDMISNSVVEIILTLLIRIAWSIVAVILFILSVVGIQVDDILASFLRLFRLRDMLLRLMARLKPVTEAIEPEVMWVFREVLRVRAVKEIILPVAMGAGPVVEVLGEPEVIERMGNKEG
ncbi:MAG: hypothetical protein SVY53_07505 [Chloroflexota bacterium]|nr:hypothetical protein [Chloroflexota bacterium]